MKALLIVHTRQVCARHWLWWLTEYYFPEVVVARGRARTADGALWLAKRRKRRIKYDGLVKQAQRAFRRFEREYCCDLGGEFNPQEAL